MKLTLNICVLELPRRNMGFKHDVDLAEGTTFRLGQSKPAPDVAEKICSGVEQTRLRTPVPSCTCRVSSLFFSTTRTESEDRNDLPVAAIILGVKELEKMPVKL